MSIGQGRNVIAPPAARTFGEHFTRAVHCDLGQRIIPEEGVQRLEIALEHALLRGAPFDDGARLPGKALQDLPPAHGFVTRRTVRSRTCVRLPTSRRS